MFLAARFCLGPFSLPEEVPLSGISLPSSKLAVRSLLTSLLLHDTPPPPPTSPPGFVIYLALCSSQTGSAPCYVLTFLNRESLHGFCYSLSCFLLLLLAGLLWRICHMPVHLTICVFINKTLSAYCVCLLTPMHSELYLFEGCKASC